MQVVTTTSVQRIAHKRNISVYVVGVPYAWVEHIARVPIPHNIVLGVAIVVRREPVKAGLEAPVRPIHERIVGENKVRAGHYRSTFWLPIHSASNGGVRLISFDE